MIDAIEAGFAALNEARLDPTNDEKLAAALDRHDGDVAVRVAEIVNGYRETNGREVPFTGLPAAVTVLSDTVEIAADGNSASALGCWLNSNVLVEIGGNDNGADRVVNDVVSSVLRRYELVAGENGWAIGNITTIETFPGAITCE